MFTFIESDVGDLTPEHATLCGRTLARLHALTDRDAPALARVRHERAYFLDGPLAQLTAFAPFAAHEDQLTFLHEVGETLWAMASQLPRVAPYCGLCHGDWMHGNTLLAGDGNLAILDFDYCGYGWRIYDLATFIWSQIYDGFTFDWSKGEIYRALLAGYEAERPLAAAERSALRYFVALRQMFLFGAAIQNAPAFGISWMDGWLERSVEFIKGCLEESWDEKVGLRLNA